MDALQEAEDRTGQTPSKFASQQVALGHAGNRRFEQGVASHL